jgi:hypothetical protein
LGWILAFPLLIVPLAFLGVRCRKRGIQRGYENPKFALPGFQQKDEILDHRPFSVSEFLD